MQNLCHHPTGGNGQHEPMRRVTRDAHQQFRHRAGHHFFDQKSISPNLTRGLRNLIHCQPQPYCAMLRLVRQPSAFQHHGSAQPLRRMRRLIWALRHLEPGNRHAIRGQIQFGLRL